MEKSKARVPIKAFGAEVSELRPNTAASTREFVGRSLGRVSRGWPHTIRNDTLDLQILCERARFVLDMGRRFGAADASFWN